MDNSTITGRSDLVGQDGQMIYVDHNAKGTVRPDGSGFSAQLVKAYPKQGAPVMDGKEYYFDNEDLAELFIIQAKPPKEKKQQIFKDPNQVSMF